MEQTKLYKYYYKGCKNTKNVSRGKILVCEYNVVEKNKCYEGLEIKVAKSKIGVLQKGNTLWSLEPKQYDAFVKMVIGYWQAKKDENHKLCEKYNSQIKILESFVGR